MEYLTCCIVNDDGLPRLRVEKGARHEFRSDFVIIARNPASVMAFSNSIIQFAGYDYWRA